MPRPVDSPAPSSSLSPLCERMQQFRERMRSSCHAAASGSDATESNAIPCLLQSWRKRIEAMDDEPQQQQQQQQTHSRHHRGHRHFGHHHRRTCHTAAPAADSNATVSDASSSSSSSSSPSPPPPTCGGFPFRGTRMLHPRLERQQAVCSLSGIWSGFTSPSSSPPPSPEIYAKPRHRRHPYARCFGRASQDSDADDHRKSSESLPADVDL